MSKEKTSGTQQNVDALNTTISGINQNDSLASSSVLVTLSMKNKKQTVYTYNTCYNIGD